MMFPPLTLSPSHPLTLSADETEGKEKGDNRKRRCPEALCVAGADWQELKMCLALGWLSSEKHLSSIDAAAPFAVIVEWPRATPGLHGGRAVGRFATSELRSKVLRLPGVSD